MKRNLLSLVLAGTLALAPLTGCASQQTATDTATAATEETELSSAVQEVPEATDVQYVMYLGTNDKDTNEPVFSPEEATERAKEILVKHFGGYTIQEAEGGWVGDNGTLYKEFTLVIYLSDTTIDAVHAAADELVETFHQSAVLINSTPVVTEFYGGQNE